MYIPIVYRIPQTKSDWKNFLIVIGLFPIMIGLAIGVTSFKNYDDNVQMHTDCNVSPDEMINSRDIYQFEGVAVIDNYATTSYEDSPTEYHFIIAYFDDENSDEARLASISLNEYCGEFYETMREYSKSNEVQYITFCAKAESVSNLDESIYNYYNDYAGYCEDYFVNAVNSGLSLHYCFDDESQFEDYRQKQKNELKSAFELAAIFLAAGIVIVILGLIMRGPRQPSKKELEAAREMLKAKGAYGTKNEEDERYGYINSEDYFGKSDDDYGNQNRDK